MKEHAFTYKHCDHYCFLFGRRYRCYRRDSCCKAIRGRAMLGCIYMPGHVHSSQVRALFTSNFCRRLVNLQAKKQKVAGAEGMVCIRGSIFGLLVLA